MNYLKRFLYHNFDLNLIQRNVFNNTPLVIDHVAHRSFNSDLIKNEYLKKYNGFYLEKDTFHFDNHNATAVWLNYNGNKFNSAYINSLHNFRKNIIGTPRVFLSTYNDIYNDPNFFDTNIDLNLINWHIYNPNQKLSYDLYKQIRDKNQYLAWTLIFQNKLNHIGIEVDNIEDVLNKVQKILPLNNPESPIQVSEDGDLLQFSTKSKLYPHKFTEGTFEVPRNFIEFVQRKNNRDGFSQKNANVVFNSTKN
tara:strand:- start:141 stop:893 length:753 start_codon:yes stop_codon:yes gene_type:complete